MRRYLVLGSMLSFLGIAVSATAQAADPAARLDELGRASSLRRAGIAPWELKLSFTVNDRLGKPQDTGSVDMKWRGISKEDIAVESNLIHGKLEKTRSDDPKIGREEYLLRELITETVSPVGPRQKSGVDVRQHDQKFGDVTLTCLTIANAHASYAGAPPTYCVEPQQLTSLRAQQEGMRGAIRNKPAKFQGTSVALDNKILYSGVAAITGTVESLVLLKDEQKVAIPDSDAEVSSSPNLAGGVTAGEKIAGQPPEYPRTARDMHVSGTVILAGVIDVSGRIGHLIPIASPDGTLTRAAVDAVRTWTYRPYLLNGKPTEVDTTVSVNFNLR